MPEGLEELGISKVTTLETQQCSERKLGAGKWMTCPRVSNKRDLMPDPQSVRSMGLMNSVGRMQGEMVWVRDRIRCPTCTKKAGFSGRKRVKTKTECVADPRMCSQGQRTVLSGEVWI